VKIVHWRSVPTSQKRSSRREPQEGVDLTSPTMDHFLEMFGSMCWTIVGLYVCFVFQFLMVLVFHVYIHRLLPHEQHWYPHQAYYLPWWFSSNLVVKSWDEISFKGGVDCNSPGVY
jgi:hypothetical protein